MLAKRIATCLRLRIWSGQIRLIGLIFILASAHAAGGSSRWALKTPPQITSAEVSKLKAELKRLGVLVISDGNGQDNALVASFPESNLALVSKQLQESGIE